MKRLITFCFLVLTASILSHSEISLYYAFTGLTLWFDKMIPTLLPFMILSGIMIRLKLSEGFTVFVYPVVKPVFRVSKNVCYAMIIGFLCGFPMGAKTIRDLYARQLIVKWEADYLLAFCNNIGPVYFCGFVLPLLQRRLIAPYLLGMYGLPLLYGLVLRYTKYRKQQDAQRDYTPASAVFVTDNGSILDGAGKVQCAENDTKWLLQLLIAADESIYSSLQSILTLGGYMILFNLLNLVPHIILGSTPYILAPLFEITGGLKLLKNTMPLYALLLLPFGGLSCLAQTYSCIKGTDLSIADYTVHKLILAGITGLYYLCWYMLSSSSFMR